MYYFKGAHQQVVSFDKNGNIEDTELRKMIAGKQVLIMYENQPKIKHPKHKSIIELMNNTNGIKLETDNLSREWIHNNTESDGLYR